MSKTKRLAVLVAYGPETRAFLQSGLAERLAASHELVFAAAEPKSPAFASAPGEVAAAPTAVEPLPLTRIRRLRARAAAHWTARAARASETLAAFAYGGSAEWRRWFRSHRIDLALAGSYSSARTVPALDAANRLGIPSVVLTNSWKDVHQRPHCGPRLAGLGVYADSERRRFLAANPSFPVGSLHSIGSLHCAALLRAEELSASELRAFLGLEPLRPFVVYAAARDGRTEAGVIARLAQAVRTLPGRPQVVVRLNPMDAGDWAQGFSEGRDGVFFDRPRWAWDPGREWICPLPEDAPRWSSLLRNAAAILSRPSTVAWEAAAVGRRMLTVAWGHSQAAWEAADFQEARSRGWVRGLAHAEDLSAALRTEIDQPTPPATPAPSGAVERACALIESATATIGARGALSPDVLGEAAQ